MSTYDFQAIETKWQAEWSAKQIYKTTIDHSRPKFYALDMFPYPSGAGLHVGHPLGYIASDIVSRYKRLNGFNVLHPMGFDAFGLPAEQYAIQTGQHPAVTTEENLTCYKEQLNRIGFCYDWDRELRTTDPSYYKWTQWIFIQLFESWYNAKTDKSESIDALITIFENEGNVNITHNGDEAGNFIAEDWENKNKQEKEAVLQCYRLAFQKETTVNWCEELGTVLANDEVKNGLSERGGHEVTQKIMKQWYLRITAYADRLLEGLNRIDWSDSIKETQRNWIGRSEGAQIDFRIEKLDRRQGEAISNITSQISNLKIEVFTTRPDTIFGATFMVLAPDHELVGPISTAEQKAEIEKYATVANNKSELERKKDKSVSGVFTGAYALHPFTQKKLPIYISEYVLSGYGTGAIMAVPAHDERDHAFATKFGIDIIQVIGSKEEINIQVESYDAKYGKLMNSENFDRLSVKEGAAAIIQLAEERGFGTRKVNFKLRDAGYSRQRYWGEPFPIIHQNGVPTVISELPVKLPPVDSYEAKGTGESPLANNKEWVNTPTGRRETDTMPGYAGSSWYFLRYMDPNNDQEFAGKESLEYWNQVDIYIGGTEHATGHLLYSRFWTKFLCDRGHIQFDEPFKKLVNQGMIQGESMLLESEGRELHVPVNIASKEATLDSAQFAQLQKLDNRFETIDFSSIATDGEIKLRTQVEKMSKSKFNVVNPDDISDQYGADTLRLYEMFLGPLEDSKPWSTKGIDGTYRFLKKLWALFFDQDGNQLWTDSEASKDSMKTLHATIKKITEDIDNMSLNTSVAQFMICVNELGSQKCASKSVLEQVLILLNPFAPHITEELWNAIGNGGFIADATWPAFDEKHLIESSKVYPISINGKTRTNLEFPLDMSKEEIEKNVLADEIVQKWLDGKPPKKVIVVPGRIVNVVL
uniref:Leucine--tRNA ligase n=1 Tax=uncultured Flavobacteriia bacterium TaxID=212695 RepID=H6RII4_9BACT|nr:leucyl-tRNA synthetase [uncultured bacterium]CCG00959.1 leucyl-tRNA synthetase [uncultured Flavobacteriia bacterium]